MLTRTVITTFLAGLLMAGLAWAPAANAWGRPGYRFGCPAPRFPMVIPFGSPLYPRTFAFPRSSWAPLEGDRLFGYRLYSPGFYPRVSPYPHETGWFYRDR